MNHPDTRRWDQGWCLIAADANARDICPHPSSSPPFLLPHPLPRASELFPPSSRCGFWAGCTSWSNSECCFLSVGGMWRSWGPPTYARLATSASPLFRVASIYLVRVFLSVYPTSRSLFNPGKGEGLGRQTGAVESGWAILESSLQQWFPCGLGYSVSVRIKRNNTPIKG